MDRTAQREPELVTIIKRLAELEARAFLAPGEMRDLNALRIDLENRWPEVGAALASAYLGTVSAPRPPLTGPLHRCTNECKNLYHPGDT